MPTGKPSLLTMKDVASKLDLSLGQVRRLTVSGDLPAVKIGSQWRYHPALLNDRLKSRRNGRHRNGK